MTCDVWGSGYRDTPGVGPNYFKTDARCIIIIIIIMESIYIALFHIFVLKAL